MKNGGKLTIALVLVLAIAIYCAVLVTISNFEHGGVITIDTFIGAGVGLIGVCATIMVGLQIWNHIEMKEIRNDVNNIPKINSELNKTKASLLNTKKELHGILHEIYLSRDSDDKEQQVSDLISAIVMIYRVQSDKPNLYSSLYDILICNLSQMPELHYKPIHYEEFKEMKYDSSDENTRYVLKLHIKCLELLMKNNYWIPSGLDSKINDYYETDKQ